MSGVFGRDDEEDLGAFVGPQLAVIGAAIGMHEVAGAESSSDGEQRSGNDVALLVAGMMVRRVG